MRPKIFDVTIEVKVRQHVQIDAVDADFAAELALETYDLIGATVLRDEVTSVEDVTVFRHEPV